MTGETAGSCVDHAPTDLLDLDWKDIGQRSQKHANDADTSTRNVDLFDDIFVEKIQLHNQKTLLKSKHKHTQASRHLRKEV